MAEALATEGGRPVRPRMLPYGRQTIEQEDLDAVAAVLQGDWLTTGPHVVEFEQRVAQAVGARHGVAVSSGTAALHAALEAVGVGPGDEVIVPATTFVATANAAVFLGATPVFADVEPDTLLIDPASVAQRVTERTKAVVPVDFAGQPCHYPALRRIAEEHGIALVGDACHALGAHLGGRPVGTLADLTCFSFHPVKHVTTGEGGLVATQDEALDRRMRRFRNHGISTDHRQRTIAGTWEYDMENLGFNLRLTDIQAALGTSQLRRLPAWLERRRAIARRYDEAFADSAFEPLTNRVGDGHAYHLYVVQVDEARVRGGREAAYRALRAENIGVNVHYKPVHLHSFYRRRFGTGPGLAPAAEAAGQKILSLPMFHGMTDDDVEDVVAAVRKVEAGLR